MKVTLSKLLPLFFIAEATSQTIETQISDFEIAGNGTEYIITYQNEGCFENAQADPTLFSSTFVSIYPNEKMIVKRIESHIERENIEQQDCVRYVEPNYVASVGDNDDVHLFIYVIHIFIFIYLFILREKKNKRYLSIRKYHN